MFHRNHNQGTLDRNVFGELKRKPTFREKFLHGRASGPTKARRKGRRGSRKPPVEESSDSEPEWRPDRPAPTGDLNDGRAPGRLAQSEPLKRANRVRIQEPGEKSQGLFTPRSIRSSRRASLASGCIQWAVGCSGSPSQDLGSPQGPAPTQWVRGTSDSRRVEPELRQETDNHPPSEDSPRPEPPPSPRSRRGLDARHDENASDPQHRKTWSCSVPRRKPSSPAPPAPDGRSSLDWPRPGNVGVGRRLAQAVSVSQGLMDSSDSSSTDSSDSLDGLELLPSRWPNDRRPAVGTLQREMSALFDQKMEEIHSKSPIFCTRKS